MLTLVNDPDKHIRIGYVGRPDVMFASVVCLSLRESREGVRIGECTTCSSLGSPDGVAPDNEVRHVSSGRGVPTLGIRIKMNKIRIQTIKLKNIYTWHQLISSTSLMGTKKTHFYIVVKPIIIIIITSNTKYQDDTILCGKILLKDIRKP